MLIVSSKNVVPATDCDSENISRRHWILCGSIESMIDIKISGTRNINKNVCNIHNHQNINNQLLLIKFIGLDVRDVK